MTRRAFAMPIVLSLVLVSSLMIAVMLERQGAQVRVVDRQLRWYNEHHARLGLQEAIEAWIRQIPSGTELDTVLPSDGHFLDLELEDGTTAVVTFTERQNSVLTDLATVEPVLLEDAAAVIELTALLYGEQGPPDGLRPVGPAAISAHSTTEATLVLVAEAVLGDAHMAQDFVRNLVAQREESGRVSASAIGIAAQEAEVEPEARVRLTRMITVRPTLYYAVIELRSSTIGPADAAYGGYFTVRTVGGGSSSGTSTGRSTFLTWERLPVE